MLFGVLLKFQRGSVNPLLGAGVVQLGQLGSEMRDEVWEERVGERSEGAMWGDGREGLGVGLRGLGSVGGRRGASLLRGRGG